MEAQIQKIASTYLQNVKPTGDRGLRSRCPLCSSNRAFIISTSHGGWICWSCGERGALVSLLKKLGLTSRQVDRAMESMSLPPSMPERLRRRKMLKKEFVTLPEYILGAYDNEPTDLIQKGFDSKLLKENDVGLDLRHNRITFAIRDHLGRLAGISGRAQWEWQIPRYKVYDASPPDSTRSPPKPAGELYGIVDGYIPENRAHLYGFNHVYPERFFNPDKSQKPLIITEGYKSTLWLRQMGFTHTVGLQGSSMTAAQQRMLGRLQGPYYVLLDNEPGKSFPDRKRRCAAIDIARRLRQSGKVYLCVYPKEVPEGTAPDDLRSAEQISQVLETAATIGQLKTRK